MSRRGAAAAIAVALLVLAALAVAVHGFRMTADLGVFMPEGGSRLERLLLRQLDQGVTSSLVFVALGGAGSERLAEVSRTLAAELRALDEVAQVYNGDEPLNEADLQFALDHRYLLTPRDLAEQLSEAGLRANLEERLRAFASPAAMVEKRFLPRDPTGEILALASLWRDRGGERGPVRRHGVWFSPDPERSLLIVELESSGFDVDVQQRAVPAIGERFAAIGAADVTMTLTGPPVFSIETRDTIRADIRLLSAVAFVLVTALLLAVFRSLRLAALALTPVAAGIVVAVAAVVLAWGEVHGVTLAFGVTLTGVAIDYPIHLLAHLDGERRRAASHAARIWPTLRLGVLTTAIAYAAFIVSGFDGLRQLGVFTITGLLSAAAVTRWLLPALMPRVLPPGNGLGALHRALERGGRRLGRLAAWLIPLSVGAGALFLAITERPLRDLDVDSLSPIEVERRQVDRELRADLGVWRGSRLLLVTGPTSEHVLRRSEELAPRLDELVAQQSLAGYDMAARFLHSRRWQERQQAAIPEQPELRRRLAAALAGLPFRNDVFEPFIDEVQDSRSREPLTLDALESTRMGRRLAALLFEFEGGWVAPVLLHEVREPEALAALAGAAGDGAVHYVDLKAESTRVLGAAIDRVAGILLGFLALIYGLIAVGLRGLLTPLRVLVPTLAAVVTVTAVLVASGTALSLFHLVSLLLVVGLGLDYSLFFHRLKDNEQEWDTTFRALWVCCLSTVLVFGVLTLSSAPPLEAIGRTVAIGAALALLFAASWAPVERPRLAPARSGTGGGGVFRSLRRRLRPRAWHE